MTKFGIRVVSPESIDWSKVQLSKPSEEMRACIKEAGIDELYDLLEDDRWEESMKTLMAEDWRGESAVDPKLFG